jgi:adenylate kinase family enzyme
MIILMAGLPGTGKSTLATALAGHISGTVLSKDKMLFSTDMTSNIQLRRMTSAWN